MEPKRDNDIKNVFKISDLLLHLAYMGEKQCQDDSCLLLYGVIRDHAYSIRRMAEHESRLAQGEHAA
jgi:hypothetical protein